MFKKIIKILLFFLFIYFTTSDLVFGEVASKEKQEQDITEYRIDQLEKDVEDKLDKDLYKDLYENTVKRLETELTHTANDRDLYKDLFSIILTIVGLVIAFDIFNIFRTNRVLKTANTAKDQVLIVKEDIEKTKNNVEGIEEKLNKKIGEVGQSADDAKEYIVSIGQMGEEIKAKLLGFSHTIQSFEQSIKKLDKEKDYDEFIKEIGMLAASALEDIKDAEDVNTKYIKQGKEKEKEVLDIQFDEQEIQKL
ncbi:hypothetical protein [Peribacillus sp. FSL P2-0133]|uniref:hypothetical protein n=1 Tax=Peribacillus sp. FSL P2-0133 TaxID=2921573 RepID=UPI0030D52665